MSFNPMAWLRSLVSDGKVLKRDGNSFVGASVAATDAANTFTGAQTIAPAAATSGVRTALTLTGAADTGRTASTEQSDVYWNGARIVTWATGALALQRTYRFAAQTLAFAGASTVAVAATVDISGPPIAGTNATITAGYTLRCATGNVFFGGDVVLLKETAHVLSVEASTTTDTAGGALTIRAGAGGATNANGGALALDAGAKAGSGTDGAVSIGATNAESIALGRTGKTTTVAGALAVTQGSTLTGAVGVGGAADASAALTVTSTTQGVLFPRMTEVQRDAIASPAPGLVIYNTTTGKLNLRGASAWEVITST